MDETKMGLGELAKALAAAQAEIRSAGKDATNPHFGSSYATLASVWDACREALSKHSLAVIQTGEIDEKFGQIMVTYLIHSSGQAIKSVMRVKATKDDMQGIGSAWTYARRYSLAAIVGVAPDDDDDAVGSLQAPKNNSSRPAQRPPQQHNPQRPPQNNNRPPSQADYPRGQQSGVITEKQRNRLFAIADNAQVPEDMVRAYMRENFQKDSTKGLLRPEYDQLCNWLLNSVPKANGSDFAPPEGEALPFEKNGV